MCAPRQGRGCATFRQGAVAGAIWHNARPPPRLRILRGRHPGESRDPVSRPAGRTKNWIPAFAGMTSIGIPETVCASFFKPERIMSQHDIRSAVRPRPDQPMIDIANYVADYTIQSTEAYDTARYMLMDSLGCAMLAMKFPECVKHLGPLVPGATLSGGARVPGTSFELDPVQAAYNIGVQVRWLDFNDTWLAAEWGHPSDNLGAILAVADYLSRKNITENKPPVLMRDVLTAMIKAYEIQG